MSDDELLLGLSKELAYSELMSFSLHNSELTLRFGFGASTQDLVIVMSGLLQVVISQTEDDEPGFLVGGLSLRPTIGTGTGLLSSLGYRFRDESNATLKPSTSLLYHFHLEGDVCIEAVSTRYQIIKE